MKKFFITLIFLMNVCSLNYLNSQTPYNLKIYEFGAYANQFQTFDRVSDSLIAFHGWSAHNHSDSITLTGLLDNNLDVICIERSIGKTNIIGNIISVSRDSFILEVIDRQTFDSEIYSFSADCELKLLKTIPFESLGDFSLGGVRIIFNTMKKDSTTIC